MSNLQQFIYRWQTYQWILIIWADMRIISFCAIQCHFTRVTLAATYPTVSWFLWQNDRNGTGTLRHERQNPAEERESCSEGVALDLCLFGALVIRAGIRTPPVLFVALSWAFPGHVKVFPLLLLFRLHFIKLGLYLGWVSVGVKIGHDGKDDTHQHQQGGEENVLGPLVKRNTKKCSFGAWYKGWERLHRQS